MRYRHFLQKKYSYGQEAPFLREAGKKDASEALTEAAFREMLLHGPLSSEGLRLREEPSFRLGELLARTSELGGVTTNRSYKRDCILQLARTSELGGVTT